MPQIQYVDRPTLPPDAFNALFVQSWPVHRSRDFASVHARSLTFIGAFDEARLVGYVNVATDGGLHGFLVDPTVHPAYQRRGIGTQLVHRAIAATRAAGLEWLHVDYEPSLASFYAATGFHPTTAGVVRLQVDDTAV